MLVFYSCYGGTHTSVVCASLHVGLLPDTAVPDQEALLRLPGFDTARSDELGHITSFGMDGGSRILVASLGPKRHIGMAALKLLLQEAVSYPGNYIVVDSLRCIDWTIRVGGFLSRRLGLVSLGRRLIVYGIRHRFECFKSLVREVHTLLGASP